MFWFSMGSYKVVLDKSFYHYFLERLIFNSMFNYFRQNNLFAECQSGLTPGDFCVGQLPSITH